MWTVAAGGSALDEPARVAARFLPCNHTCYVMLCRAMPCYAMLCHMLCHAMHAVQCCTMETVDLACKYQGRPYSPEQKICGEHDVRVRVEGVGGGGG